MNVVAVRRLAASRHAILPVAARSTKHLQRRTYSEPTRDPQLGDYPDVPPVPRAYLPPKGWWDNQMRRNFGDLVRAFRLISFMPCPHVLLLRTFSDLNSNISPTQKTSYTKCGDPIRQTSRRDGPSSSSESPQPFSAVSCCLHTMPYPNGRPCPDSTRTKVL